MGFISCDHGDQNGRSGDLGPCRSKPAAAAARSPRIFCSLSFAALVCGVMKSNQYSPSYFNAKSSELALGRVRSNPAAAAAPACLAYASAPPGHPDPDITASTSCCTRCWPRRKPGWAWKTTPGWMTPWSGPRCSVRRAEHLESVGGLRRRGCNPCCCRRLPPLPPAACCCPHAGPPLACLCCPPYPLAALAFLAVDLFFCRSPVRGPLLRLFSQSGQTKQGQRRFLSQVGSVGWALLSR